MEEGQGAADAPRWSRALAGLVRGLGTSFAWLGLAMVVLTAAIVVLRYAFSIGSVALQEVVLFMHATLFLSAAGYALVEDAHVRVDVLYRGWPPARKALVDLLGSFLLLGPTCGFMIWSSLPYVAAAWRIREGSSETGGLPGVFLLKTLLLVAPTLLLVAGLARVGRCVQVLLRSGSARR